MDVVDVLLESTILSKMTLSRQDIPIDIMWDAFPGHIFGHPNLTLTSLNDMLETYIKQINKERKWTIKGTVPHSCQLHCFWL